MSTVGQVERKTQQRVVRLVRDTLGYNYLGDWTDRIEFCAARSRELALLSPAAIDDSLR